jgi:Zn-finger nucleic acid-binding protein
MLDYGLLYCQGCQGTLIQMGDLVPLTDDLRASRGAPAYVGRPPDPRDLDRRISCPQCHQTMDNHLYGGPGNIVMDTCEHCEPHWLDRGELRRIALAPDHHYST